MNAGPRLRRDGREGVEGVLPRNYLLRAILACFRGGHQRAIFTTFFAGSLLFRVLLTLTLTLTLTLLLLIIVTDSAPLFCAVI